MQKLKKFSSILALTAIIFVYFLDVMPIIQNFDDNITAVVSSTEDCFVIYNQNGEEINTSMYCEVGDMFVSSDNVLYEIYYVDTNNKIAYAKAKTQITLPKVNNKAGQFSKITTQNKVMCMYHTHNDESYVLGDGYDSVYGKGGIMDIGELLSNELNKHNITVYRSEALHLPHDYNAYSRSNPTAKNLISSYSPDAIFDVHRDGVARNQYITTVNGQQMSKVRMVIGKSNSNYQTNLDFAIAIKAYADSNYQGFIKDIYMGSGHYNQALSATSILFEMGTYLIEKDYVISSVPILAEIIDKVVYEPTVTAPSEDKTYNEVIEDLKTTGQLNNTTISENNNSNATTVVVEEQEIPTSNTLSDIVAVLVIFAIVIFIGFTLKLLINKLKRTK